MASLREIDGCVTRKRRSQVGDQAISLLHGPFLICVLPRIGLGSRGSSSVAAIRVTVTIPRSSGMLE